MNIRKNISAIFILTLVLTSLPVNAVKTFAGEDGLLADVKLTDEIEVSDDRNGNNQKLNLTDEYISNEEGFNVKQDLADNEKNIIFSAGENVIPSVNDSNDTSSRVDYLNIQREVSKNNINQDFKLNEIYSADSNSELASDNDTNTIKYGVSLGGYHSAALKEDGSLWMWGYNIHGQLGNGSTEQETMPSKILDNVKQISIANYYSGAIKKDGSLWMWGENDYGQLGDGTYGKNIYKTTPIKIMENVKEIRLGSGCQASAIKEDGSLWMWGNNRQGQIGDGTNIDKHTPIKVMDNIVSVCPGGVHSAAIKEDGSLWMWGENDYGQLGDGNLYNNESSPIKIMENVKQVSLGGYHSAALQEDGSLWMWGKNSCGQLGDGTYGEYRISKDPVKIMDNVIQVDLGLNHSAAIKEDGSLWMWGNNSSGELGDGSEEEFRATPVKIMDNVMQVDLGWNHSAAIKEDGSLWVWGYNFMGQVGDGTTTDRNTPVKIMDLFSNGGTDLLHTVTFDSNGGSKVSNQKVKDGSSAVKPSDPTKNEFAFEGWYSDEALEHEYDFSTPVISDFTLFAKWSEASQSSIPKDDGRIYDVPVNSFSIHKEGNTTPLEIKWTFEDFKDSAFNYNHRLAIAGLALSAAANNSKNGNYAPINDMLSNLGFDTDPQKRMNENYVAATEIDNPGTSIASKQIIVDGTIKTLIVIVIRGTTDGTSDIKTDLNAIINGYSVAGSNVRKLLDDYINNNYHGKLNLDNTILYITGHSLGAATASILAQNVDDIAYKTDTYVYTYASPNYDLTDDYYEYNDRPFNIHSIINVDDSVPNIIVTKERLTKRVIYKIDSLGAHVITINKDREYNRINESMDFDVIYKNLTGSQYSYNQLMTDRSIWQKISLVTNIYNGIGIWDNNTAAAISHSVETYMSFLLSHAPTDSVSSRVMRLVKVECPVDVKIHDLNGALCGQIINNKAIYSESTDIVLMTDGDKKYILMPYGENYEISLAGTDEGVMKYSIIDTDCTSNATVNEVVYENVSLEKGKAFYGELTDRKKTLFVVDDNNEPIKEVEKNGSEVDIKKDTVSVNKITFDITSHTIEAGKTFTITPTFDPTNATNKTLTWESDNTAVATVADGVVTAKAAGTANIKATTHNGKSAICKVVVTKENGINSGMPGSVITAKKVDISVAFEKSTEEIRFTIKDKSQKKLATVSSKGLLTAKKSGTVTITLQQKDGKTWKDIKDISYEIVVPKGSTLPFGKAYYEGQTWDLNTLIREYNIYSPDAWETKTKNSIATLDSNTGILTVGNTNGTATAYAIYGTGKYARKVKVAVKINHKKVDISEVFSSVSGKTRYKILDKVDRKRASVSTKGILTAKKDGSVTTTLQVKDGNTWRDVESKVIHITNPLQCISIEEPGQDTPANGKEYVVNRATGVFHRPDCYKVKEIQDKKYVTSTYQDMINKEYKACGICKPD